MKSGSRSRLVVLAQGSFLSVALPILLFLCACSPYAGADSNPSYGFQLKKFNDTTIHCYGSSGLTPSDHVLSGAICLVPPQVNQSAGEISGNCVYKDRLHFDPTGSFSTMFSFTTLVYPQFQPGQGFTFFIGPDNYTMGGAGGYLGWLNESTATNTGHNFAVEFDICKNPEFYDPDEDHVGINFNNMVSAWTAPASELDFNLTTHQSDAKLYVWIDYNNVNGSKSTIEVSLNNKPEKPCKALMSYVVPRPWELLEILQDDMYVGFSSSTGGTINAQTTVWDWSFNTSGEAENIYGHHERCHWTPSRNFLMTVISSVLGSFVILLLGILLILRVRWLSKAKKVAALEHEKADLEEENVWLIRELKQLDLGPREFSYLELKVATEGFADKVGEGGFGDVYKGKLGIKPDEKMVAVKKIKENSVEDAKQLMAEVKVIGRVRHRHIVSLIGWCYERGQMFLVYPFMEKGDLETHLFPKVSQGAYVFPEVFPWQKRMNILKGVAAALRFLHEEFESEQRVLHRDIKPRNVMLDAQFNARLGDFGLAQLCERKFKPHDDREALMGTPGYVAPEYAMGATTKTDVYSFGVLVLVAATGRNPLDNGSGGRENGGLVKWVRSHHDAGSIAAAGDMKLKSDPSFNGEEMKKVLTIGLFCCLHEAECRPTMRDVVTALHENSPKFSQALPPQTPPRLSVEASLLRFEGDHSFSYRSNTDSGYHSSERFMTAKVIPEFSSDHEFYNSAPLR